MSFFCVLAETLFISLPLSLQPGVSTGTDELSGKVYKTLGWSGQGMACDGPVSAMYE